MSLTGLRPWPQPWLHVGWQTVEVSLVSRGAGGAARLLLGTRDGLCRHEVPVEVPPGTGDHPARLSRMMELDLHPGVGGLELEARLLVGEEEVDRRRQRFRREPEPVQGSLVEILYLGERDTTPLQDSLWGEIQPEVTRWTPAGGIVGWRSLLSSDLIIAEQTPAEGSEAAVRSYVRAGGTLVLLPGQDAAWLGQPLPREPRRGPASGVSRYGLGEVLHLEADPWQEGTPPGSLQVELLQRPAVAARGQDGPDETAATSLDLPWRGEPISLLRALSQGLPAAPGSGLVGGVLALYLLLLGPVHFLIQRRRGRLTASLVSIPALALLCTGAILVTGLASRGLASRLHRCTVITLSVDGEAAFRSDYMLLCAGRAGPYTLGTGPASAVPARIAIEGESQAAPLRERADGGWELGPVPLPLWGRLAATRRQPLPAAGAVTLEVTAGQTIRLHNQSEWSLGPGEVVAPPGLEDVAHRLLVPPLPPGARWEMALSRARPDPLEDRRAHLLVQAPSSPLHAACLELVSRALLQQQRGRGGPTYLALLPGNQAPAPWHLDGVRLHVPPERAVTLMVVR